MNHELINVLKETIKEGNEDYDSLKTFIYKQIKADFCNGVVCQFGIMQFLNDVIREVESQLQTNRLSL